MLVGTSRGPQDVAATPRVARKIRTTWGELAWQLGGAEAFDMIAENDAKGIAPGSNLLEAIFKKYAPCLILIDEWVAYLRQIYRVEGLPSGSFDANLSFVQSLTEAVKASPRTLLVASLAGVSDRGRRRRRPGGAGPPQADLQPRGIVMAAGEPGGEL